ncbi:MAG: glycogen-binding domain-containing protein [Kiritimatiellae bacterium]|jgi:1,4-alpha-glucan branching enzyme|nr:glycogen-binding domain-containing protein [Kiritimatiellia bacterium]
MSVKGKRRVTFTVKAQPKVKVSVAGTFNKWIPGEKIMTDRTGKGDYSVTMLLDKGKYEYKFLIGDKWTIDPECEEWVTNDLGSMNSLIVVK